MMKKLPNINLDLPVKIVPYSFDDDKGKKKRGLTIYQNEQKVSNFYYDTETKEVANGYPKVKMGKKKWSTDDWKLYFLNARVFLINDISERFKISLPEVVEEDIDKLADEMENEAKRLTSKRD